MAFAADMALNYNNNQPNKMLIKCRWRQKVYSLLTQQKSAELVAKKDFQKWQQKVQSVFLHFLSDVRVFIKILCAHAHAHTHMHTLSTPL